MQRHVVEMVADQVERNDKQSFVKMLYDKNYKIVDIVKQTGLSRATVYRVLKDLGLR